MAVIHWRALVAQHLAAATVARLNAAHGMGAWAPVVPMPPCSVAVRHRAANG